MTENKRFKHTFNGIGMQFISYDDKNVSMGTFADEESIDCIVDVLNELSDKIVQLNDENEQLKKDVDYWKQVALQYSNEVNVFEHSKKYKTECKNIHSSNGEEKSCGFCKHCQLDGMFGMWCDIHETFYDAENCPNYER